MRALLPLTAAAVLALDQLSKYLVVTVLDLRDLVEFDVLSPYLVFRMAWNYGVNFGLFSDDSPLLRWVLILGALVISGLVVSWARRAPDHSLVQLAAGLVIGGALGNVVDRLIWGAVADFLNMSCCGIDNPFSFNIADVAIFAGMAGLIFFAPSGGKTP